MLVSCVLQWVHGSQTVVIFNGSGPVSLGMVALMGSRFANRGYSLPLGRGIPAEGCFNGSTVRKPWLFAYNSTLATTAAPVLQWVHGSQTVVIAGHTHQTIGNVFASMGPRFANRGYCP